MAVPILKQSHYLIASIQSVLSDKDLIGLRDDLAELVGQHRARGVIIDVTALQEGRALASRAGFSSSSLTVIATAISEIARNIVEYAKEGDVTITLLNDGHRKGVEVVATDRGPGIPDIATVMRDGYSTGRGMGIGLP